MTRTEPDVVVCRLDVRRANGWVSAHVDNAPHHADEAICLARQPRLVRIQVDRTASSAAALQVSAHQSGYSITAASSRRWPAGLGPAEIGAPRRNRTYNPLVAGLVIRRSPASAAMLLKADSEKA
jgi:hypothetical protein